MSNVFSPDGTNWGHFPDRIVLVKEPVHTSRFEAVSAKTSKTLLGDDRSAPGARFTKLRWS